LTDNGEQICQTGAIMRHLGRKHDLYGSTEAEKTFVDMVYEGLKDFHPKYTNIIYKEYDKKPDFVANVLPKELATLERLVKMHNDGKGLLLGGTKACFADYWLFEELDILRRMDKNCLDAFPVLHAYHDRMMARPNLKEYLHSEKHRTRQINGNTNV